MSIKTLTAPNKEKHAGRIEKENHHNSGWHKEEERSEKDSIFPVDFVNQRSILDASHSFIDRSVPSGEGARVAIPQVML